MIHFTYSPIFYHQNHFVIRNNWWIPSHSRSLSQSLSLNQTNIFGSDSIPLIFWDVFKAKYLAAYNKRAQILILNYIKNKVHVDSWKRSMALFSFIIAVLPLVCLSYRKYRTECDIHINVAHLFIEHGGKCQRVQTKIRILSSYSLGCDCEIISNRIEWYCPHSLSPCNQMAKCNRCVPLDSNNIENRMLHLKQINEVSDQISPFARSVFCLQF